MGSPTLSIGSVTGLAGGDDADDLTQETMVKISNGLEGFLGDSTISTWIYRIATNVARDRFRSAACRRDTVTDPVNEEEFFPPVDETGSAHGSLEDVTVRKEMNT
jgi:RNA polymerase sigma-70 factor (ECF subfamily)